MSAVWTGQEAQPGRPLCLLRPGACRRGARQAHSRSPAGVTNLRLQCQRHKGFLGRVGCPCRVATQRQGVPLHPPGFAAVEGIDGLPVAGLQRGPLAAVDGARSTASGWRRVGVQGTKGIVGGVDFALLNLRC